MARYTGPVCRLCRREKMKLFLKGPKCDTMKCPIERRPYPPGDHGRGRIRESEYLLQLREKRLEISLTYIFGIGRTKSQEVCTATGINADTRVRDLTDEEVSRLRNYIDQNLKVEGDLRRDIAQDIKRKIEIQCYQGIRHRRGLPVRGQRTHTNARTRKGPKKTVAGKKKVRKH